MFILGIGLLVLAFIFFEVSTAEKSVMDAGNKMIFFFAITFAILSVALVRVSGCGLPASATSLKSNGIFETKARFENFAIIKNQAGKILLYDFEEHPIPEKFFQVKKSWAGANLNFLDFTTEQAVALPDATITPIDSPPPAN